MSLFTMRTFSPRLRQIRSGRCSRRVDPRICGAAWLVLAAAGCARPRVGVPDPPQLASFSLRRDDPRLVAAGIPAHSTAGPEAITPEIVETINQTCVQATARPCVKAIALAGAGRELVLYRHPEATVPAPPRAAVSSSDGGAVADSFAWYVKRVTGPGVAALGGRGPVVEAHYLWESPAPVPEKASAAELSRSSDRQVAAAADPKWALRQINYFDAQRLLESRIAERARLGEAAKDVVIVHTDTGYTLNCQFADGSTQPVSPLDTTRGRDFFTDPLAGDARDPMTPPTWVPESRQPGHGTRTGTALVSPHSLGVCKPPQLEDKVSGVAPSGVKLVPVRVTDGIVLGLPKSLKTLFPPLDHRLFALSLAIEHASRPRDPYFPDPAQVISISLGGQSDQGVARLRCVADWAERSGVIIVAAAGQMPAPKITKWLFFGGKQPVAFPGRFPSTIAVAGSTLYATPWEDSSRGKEVDVTAPAEYVWRADTECGRGETVDMGRGTSFSTALTAGVAALWLQYHGYERLYDLYGPALSSAFRWVLAHGGTRSPKELADALDADPGPVVASYRSKVREQANKKAWDTKNFGPGLLNAEGVLRAKLPSREEVCSAEKARRSGEEWQAICPPTWAGHVPRPDLEAGWASCSLSARVLSGQDRGEDP
jgi:subtilisin family serine protease